MRYEHFVNKAKGEAFPKRLVILDCESEYLTIPGKEIRQKEKLVSWHCAGWSERTDGKVILWEAEGLDVKGLWTSINWGLKRGGKTYVISPMASRVWGLCGIWEKIDNGQLRFTGQGDKRQQQSVRNSPMSGVSRDVVSNEQESRPATVPNVASGGFIVLEDPPTILQCRSGNLPGMLVLLDSRNYGIEERFKEKPGLVRCRLLREAFRDMVDILKDNNLGSFQMTAGSQAMYSYRKKYITDPIFCHTNTEALALEEDAYIGGRVGCGRIGKVDGPIYHLDFRSIYPSVCAKMRLPTMLRVTGTGKPHGMSYSLAEQVQYIADVSISTPEPAYPCRTNKEVYYPIGHFRTVLCGPELYDAQMRGRIIEWHSWASYDATYALQAYANGLYDILDGLRNTGKYIVAQWLKRLLVGIVGKFGQHGYRWKDYPDCDPPAPWSTWDVIQKDGLPYRARSLGWQCQIEEYDGWSNNACPSIAAWVCSAARIALMSAMRIAELRNVYYYDTDSIICNGNGYYNLKETGAISDNRLGALRLIGSHESAVIYGQKHYELDGKLVCAGLPKGEVEDCMDDQHYWYRDWLKKAIGKRKIPQAERVLRTYSRTGNYRFGRVMRDGTVKPFLFGGDGNGTKV